MTDRRPTHCAECGERVYASNGFFRSWPDPVALHHHCVRPFLHRERERQA